MHQQIYLINLSQRYKNAPRRKFVERLFFTKKDNEKRTSEKRTDNLYRLTDKSLILVSDKHNYQIKF